MANYNSELTELTGLTEACQKILFHLQGVNPALRAPDATQAALDDLVLASTYLRRANEQLTRAQMVLGIRNG